MQRINKLTIIVTGGAGFIGSNFVYHMLDAHSDFWIVYIDKLTYAGNLSTLAPLLDETNLNYDAAKAARFRFCKVDMRRMSVASEENFEGKLFVQFVALQLVSYIKKQMDEHGLFSTYTIQSLLDELDVIEYYQQPGKAHYLSEITQKQRDLYEMMNVPVPT